jgi:predicted ATPase
MPADPTSFVGRRREVDGAIALLARVRLLTLTGPGGTGKTRLATRVANEAQSTFRDGVFFVDLASVTDPALVAPSIAHTLGLADTPDKPTVEQLKAHLEPLELLLVLDNFEHLLVEAPLVGDLLQAAARLKALVTSRSALSLYGEQELPVPPLQLPEPPSAPGWMACRSRSSLLRAGSGCWSPPSCWPGWKRRLPLLTGGASNVPARQRTLRGTIEWSYELLQPAQRTLFARLAIFVGGWNLEAAEAIANPNRELELDTVEGVAALLDQNLIRRRGERGESRLGMLETIREYGLERLAADGSFAEIASRQLGYFRDLAESAERHFIGPQQTVWLDRFDREHDNVRAALSRAVEADAGDDGLRLASAVWALLAAAWSPS